MAKCLFAMTVLCLNIKVMMLSVNSFIFTTVKSFKFIHFFFLHTLDARIVTNILASRRELYTRAVLKAGFLMGTDDFLAQTVTEKQKVSQVDYLRTLKFFSIGFCVAVSTLNYIQ